jgi:hypothetical protein
MKRLRQVALVARELDPVVAALERTLGLAVGFRDPGVAEFGLRNALFPVGDQFLEVVSPTQPGTTAGRFLERRGGDGGYMVIVQTDDLAGDRTRLATAGVRIVWEIAFDDIATVHLHPRDVGGAIVSLDEAVPPESWRWGGPAWRDAVRRDVCTGIVGVEVAAVDPARMAARWGEVLDRRATEDGDRWSIALDDAVIRFAPAHAGRGEGVDGLVLRAASPAHRGVHEISGVRLTLVDG